MKIIIINTRNLPCIGTLLFTFKKLSLGFASYGYSVFEINDEEQLKNLEDSEKNIFLFSNHGMVNSNHDLNLFLPFNKFKKSYKILWFYADTLIKNYTLPLTNYILTSEHWRSEPELESHARLFKFHKNLTNYVPLTFSSFLTPESIGTFKRTDKFDAQFVGAFYKNEWTRKIENSLIYNTPPYISEDFRIDTYLNSICSLGFHSKENILNKCVVERVPEALSLGCVVLTDNPTAVLVTDGITELVSSLEETKEKIKFYKHNKHERERKIHQGYLWAKSFGTYKHVAENFLNKIKEI